MPLRSLHAALLIGVAAASSFAAPAQAAQIVQHISLTDNFQPITSFTLDRFDASLGTLTGVSYAMSWGGIGFYNATGPRGGGYRMLGIITASARSSDGVLDLLLLSLPGVSGTFGDSGTVSGFFDGTARTSGALTLSELGQFIGTAPIRADFTHSEQIGMFVPNGSGVAGLVLTSGQLSLTYDYIAAAVPSVPEPATWAMMIAGFGAVGTRLRRQRRASIRLA